MTMLTERTSMMGTEGRRMARFERTAKTDGAAKLKRGVSNMGNESGVDLNRRERRAGAGRARRRYVPRALCASWTSSGRSGVADSCRNDFWACRRTRRRWRYAFCGEDGRREGCVRVCEGEMGWEAWEMRGETAVVICVWGSN